MIAPLDIVVIVIYFLISILIGFIFKSRAEGNIENYFLAGRRLNWFLAGTSSIATALAADTSVQIISLVRAYGVQYLSVIFAGGIGAIFSAIFFTRLIRRSEVLTMPELLELRYGGKTTKIYRFYLAIVGIFWGIVGYSMGLIAVSYLIMRVFPLNQASIFIIISFITLIYTVSSGMWGDVITDAFQFIISFVGIIILMIVALNYVGGMESLLIQVDKISKDISFGSPANFFPRIEGPLLPIIYLITNFSVIWWLGGFQGPQDFTSQRVLATKDVKNSFWSVIWYSFVTLVIRTWPIVIIALCSIVIYPSYDNSEEVYAKMISDFLPIGLKGLLIASLIAGYMSTADTQLNMSSALFINDIYKRFFRKSNKDRHYVKVARFVTVIIATLSIIYALYRPSIIDNMMLITTIGAGSGLVQILRWYWLRINIWSEISALVSSIIFGFILHFGGLLSTPELWPLRLLINVLLSAAIWIPVTFLTRSESIETLKNFINKVKPSYTLGYKGKPDIINFDKSKFVSDFKAWLTGSFGLIFLTYGIGKLLFCYYLFAAIFISLGLIFIFFFYKTIKHFKWD